MTPSHASSAIIVWKMSSVSVVEVAITPAVSSASAAYWRRSRRQSLGSLAEDPQSAGPREPDSCKIGPLRGCGGPFARWEGFEPPAA